jgi:hypothetical protein
MLTAASHLEAQAPAVRAAADVRCPAPLGAGVSSGRAFCDVLSGRDPEAGVVVTLPPHRGPLTLTFDLHNRHTYSEEQIRANRAYARYTAVVGVYTLEQTLIGRGAIESEFRRGTDVVDRIGGGAGPDGLKAVVPNGVERITITVPENVNAVSILGETLTVQRPDGTATYTAAGRPIAIISNAEIEYRAAPPARPREPGH